MTDSHEIAWAAGLFDGEGTTFASATLKRKRRNVRLHMAIRMTTLDDIERFHRAVGLGSIAGPYQAKGPRKPQWAWRAGTDENVRRCIDLLWPYLGKNKRVQAQEALRLRDEHLANPEPLNLRKAFCRRGHDQSLYRRIYPSGKSHCVLCQRITYVAWRDRIKALNGDAPLFAEVA